MTNELAIRILTGDVLGTASQTSEAIKTAVKALSISSAQPELTDGQAIEHLQETGWMQSHDKQMYEMGLRERLADDSDSYDALLPSTQPERKKGAWINGGRIIRCNRCKIGYATVKGMKSALTYKFCPNCGADMRGECNE